MHYSLDHIRTFHAVAKYGSLLAASRHLGRFGTANLPDKHTEALTALREGDPSRAAAAIGDDIRQGFGQVRLTLSD